MTKKPETQFTIGPWEIGIDDEPMEGVKGIEINGDNGKINIGYVMAQEVDHYTPVDRANASLIAAAPDMFDLLKKHVAWWDENEDVKQGGKYIDEMRAAILSATTGR